MKTIWNQYSYAIVLMTLSCCLAFMISLRFNSVDHENFLTITVSEGDSLWNISNQFSEQHTLSNNEFVNWVVQYNNIDGDQIFPGEEIIIPVTHETHSLTELASAAGE